MSSELDALQSAIDRLAEAGADVAELQASADVIRSGYVRKQPDHFKRVGYLRSLATAPKTIIDIGVSAGTPALYRAFADHDFLLVDPQRNAESHLLSRPKNYRFVEKGLGSKAGKLTLTESASQSSFLDRVGDFAGEYTATDRYEVDVITFREMIETYKPAAPYGVKIDTEGFELEVVRGMAGTFEDIDFLICETSVRRMYSDSYQFSELVAFLADHGLLFFNILNEVRAWPRFYDTVFLRADNPRFGAIKG